jgi:hypothetical protein
MKVKIISIALIAAIALFGCKKISSDEQTVVVDNVANQKAQDWFQKQNKQPDTVTASTVKFNDTEPQWDKTKRFVTAKMLITPMPVGDAGKSCNAAKYLVMQQNAAGDIESGYYCFILSKGSKPEAGPSLLAGNFIPADFTGAIVKYGLDGSLIAATHYENGKVADKEDRLTVKLMSKNDNGGSTQSLAPINCNGPQVCTDWYWQT